MKMIIRGNRVTRTAVPWCCSPHVSLCCLPCHVVLPAVSCCAARCVASHSLPCHVALPVASHRTACRVTLRCPPCRIALPTVSCCAASCIVLHRLPCHIALPTMSRCTPHHVVSRCPPCHITLPTVLHCATKVRAMNHGNQVKESVGRSRWCCGVEAAEQQQRCTTTNSDGMAQLVVVHHRLIIALRKGHLHGDIGSLWGLDKAANAKCEKENKKTYLSTTTGKGQRIKGWPNQRWEDVTIVLARVE